MTRFDLFLNITEITVCYIIISTVTLNGYKILGTRWLETDS